MNTLKLAALSVLASIAIYGCAAKSDDSDSAVSSDQLILGQGSVDHAAIVEATTMQLTQGVTDFGSTLDPYNQADPFSISPDNYRTAFLTNIAKFDDIDGQTDWTDAQAAAWAGRMSTGNYQIFDLAASCNYDEPHSYLEIERAQLTGGEHATCGGRNPNEDAMDVTLNFLIRGPAASEQDDDAIRDGVSQATQKATRDFPYLAEYNSL